MKFVFCSKQGNFEAWVQDLLHIRPNARVIWDPYFGQMALESFTRWGALGQVNIPYSGVYQWILTIYQRGKMPKGGASSLISLA